jgi:hypothetical protein
MGPITDRLFRLSFHDCPETALFFTKKKTKLAVSSSAANKTTSFQV